MEILTRYINGNYNVVILKDGTKIRFNDKDEFVPAFPESMDIKITNCCRNNCKFCYACSSPEGKHADLNHPIFDSFHKGMELAIGGGNAMEHPHLEEFLIKMRNKGIICNITLHLNDFIENYSLLRQWQNDNLIYGIGVSINDVIKEEYIDFLRRTPNLVVHCIAGVVSFRLLNQLSNNNLSLLILGYKTIGKGVNFFDNDVLEKILMLKNSIKDYTAHFKLIAYDNLALEQLSIKDIINPAVWKSSYMGGDGEFSMYFDAVEMKYSVSSISPLKHILSNNIDDVFNEVRSDIKYDA